VVAIIGVETRYGNYMGKYRVIDALATLAFDYPRRSKFFTGELEFFLIMARDEGLDPFGPRGSYAGAMGLGQFMPSSFRRWAVDFDGNGKCDLWNPADTIGSVANYFVSHGWRKGEPVAVRISASGAGVGAMKTGYDTSYSLDALRRNGIAVTAGLDGRERVNLIKLDAAGDYEYWPVPNPRAGHAYRPESKSKSGSQSGFRFRSRSRSRFRAWCILIYLTTWLMRFAACLPHPWGGRQVLTASYGCCPFPYSIRRGLFCD